MCVQQKLVVIGVLQGHERQVVLDQVAQCLEKAGVSAAALQPSDTTGLVEGFVPISPELLAKLNQVKGAFAATCEPY